MKGKLKLTGIPKKTNKKEKTGSKSGVMSLQTKLMALMGSISFIFIVILGCVSLLISGKSIKSISNEKLSAEVKGASNSINYFVQAQFDQLNNYGSNQGIMALLDIESAPDNANEATAPADNSEMHDMMISMVQKSFASEVSGGEDSSSGVEDVFAIDKSGAVKIAATKEMSGKSVADEEFFSDLKSGITMVISDVVVSKATNRNVVTLAVPVKDKSGKFAGAVCKYIGAGAFDNMLSSYLDGDHFIYIADKSGNIVYHPDTTYSGQQVAHENLKDIVAKDTQGMGVIEYTEKGAKVRSAYAENTKTGWTIYSSTPIALVNKPVTSIRTSLIILAVVILVLMEVILLVISKSIAKPIKKVTDLVKKVADGDLTNKVKESNANKEVYELSKGINTMIDNLSDLIKDTSKTVSKVEEASTNLCALSEEVAASNSELTKQIAVISQNTSNQAKEATNSSVATQHLGDSIEVLDNKNGLMENQGKLVIKSLEVNTDKLGYLMESNSKSKESFASVMETVEKLIKNISNISSIIGVIDEISKQTSLLSLNASIESARAGEAGRGFAVVAAEIRGLADDVQKATNDISSIIKGTDEIVELTRASINVSSELSEKQTLAYNEVNSAFEEMKESLSKMMSITDEISGEIENVNSRKTEVLGSVEEMAAGAQEVAATTEEANQSIDEQGQAFDNVSANAEELIGYAADVKKSIEKFTM